MKYLDSLGACFSHRDQVNLIYRIRIRLGQEVVSLQSACMYVSEDDLDKRHPISTDVFAFSDWTALREELEQLVTNHVLEPRLLESILVRYFQTFDSASSVLFPDEKYTDDADLLLATTIRSLSSYYGYNTNIYDPTARSGLAEYLQRHSIGPITDGLLNAFQKDLALLHRLLEAMNFVAEIMQGVLYEISAPFNLQTIREDSQVKLTDVLYSWKMAPLMGWTSAYAQKLMGERIEIDLENDKLDPVVPSRNEKIIDNIYLTDENGTEKKVQDRINDAISIEKKPATSRAVFLSDDKITKLGLVLRKDHFTKKDIDGKMIFIKEATLYGYLGYKLREVCELPTIPWQQLLQIIPYKETRKDNSYFKSRASYYKNTKKYPPGYSIINAAIDEAFKP